MTDDDDATMTDDQFGPILRIAAVAGLAGVLLLLAPWTPPQVAVFGFVGLFVLGVVTYFGASYVVTELARGWGLAGSDDEADGDPDEPDELAELRERYLTDPSFDERDFEAAVEEVVSHEVVAGDILEEDLDGADGREENDADRESESE